MAVRQIATKILKKIFNN